MRTQAVRVISFGAVSPTLRTENNTKNVLVLLLPGLGDAIVASPLVRAIHEQRPNWNLHALTMLAPVKEYANALDVFETVHHVPLLTLKPYEAFQRLTAVRRSGFDNVVVPYPAGRWQYHAVARLLSRGEIVTHRYPSALVKLLLISGSSLTTDLSGKHRVHENLRLLSVLGINYEGAADHYSMPLSWSVPGDRHGIAIHPGSMRYKGNEVRRWPLDRFRDLMWQLPAEEPIYVISGPNEREEAQWLIENGPASAAVLEGPLADVARKISQCKLLISNDSGMAHVGAGLNVQTIVLFGMTRPDRALPPGAIPVRPSQCPPCFDEFSPAFTCTRRLNFQCIREDLRVSHVLHALKTLPAVNEPKCV